jgi:hypothetical protein
MKPRNVRYNTGDVYGHVPPTGTIDAGEPADHSIPVPANIATVLQHVVGGPLGFLGLGNPNAPKRPAARRYLHPPA